MRIMVLAAMVLVTVGCSTGFNRVAMQSELEHEARIFTDDPDVFQIEQVRPQLQVPFRLAVVPPSMINRCSWGQPGETEGERAAILAWGEKLKAEGVVSELILIPEMLIGVNSAPGTPGAYKAVRVAAARLGADAILILRSVTETDSYINPLSLLDLTIVGLWVAPGHHKDTLTVVEGLLIDNRNQYVYFAGSAEGKGSQLAPALLLDEKDAVRESRCAALKAFGDLVLQQSRVLPGSGFRYSTPGK